MKAMKPNARPHSADPNLAGVAALIGDPARAAMLLALCDGLALPASELAYRGGVSPQAASAHFRNLVDAGLLAVSASGRQRLYRLATREVAGAIEALLLIAAPPPIVALGQSIAMQRLRDARTCYDHLAGRLGVAVTDALLSRGLLRAGTTEFRVMPQGERFFADLGIDVAALRGGRRTLARPCMDWTERRPHLAGSLGMALHDRFLAGGWMVRHTGDRSVRLTDRGRRAVVRLFGVAALTASRRSA
jgi:DNA-binding transcriptional ArsR family regulator